jgi:soluble lytic murein transglycosylase
MRGIGYTLSRLPSARAIFAGAAIVAGTLSSPAHGQSSGSGNGSGTVATQDTRAEEAALAVPHASRNGPSDAVFPKPLRPGDAAIMQRVFAFQRRGDTASARKASAELEDPLLLGSVLADRYLGRYYQSTSVELSDWLARYRDLPDAAAIHALLLIKLPKGAKPPPAPEVATLKHAVESESAPEDIDLPRNDFVRDPGLDRTVLDYAQRGNPAAALRAISLRRGIAR